MTEQDRADFREQGRRMIEAIVEMGYAPCFLIGFGEPQWENPFIWSSLPTLSKASMMVLLTATLARLDGMHSLPEPRETKT